jgi:hypothetical protein
MTSSRTKKFLKDKIIQSLNDKTVQSLEGLLTIWMGTIGVVEAYHLFQARKYQEQPTTLSEPTVSIESTNTNYKSESTYQ